MERNGCENSIVLDLPPLALTVYAYEPFTKLELEEIRIREEAELAAKAAQEQAWQAEQLKVKAEEEAQAALEAQNRLNLRQRRHSRRAKKPKTGTGGRSCQVKNRAGNQKEACGFKAPEISSPG